MAENGKRKDAPAGGRDQQAKKKKTGNAGKWKTTHQQSKALHQDANLQPGDTGIWVTCARHQEARAAREIGVLFAEYAEKMYDIKSIHDTAAGEAGGDGDAEEDDIEAAIQKEVAALTSKPTAATAADAASSSSAAAAGGDTNRMTPLKMNVDCLLYVKTQPPVDPVAFVRRICEDARRCEELPGVMRCRYVNRLTPVSVMGRATETGLVEVAREVLGRVFDLSGKRQQGASEKGAEGEVKGEPEEAEGEEKGEVEGQVKGEATAEAGSVEAPATGSEKPFTFAIRPTIRNHSKLKRDFVINTVAGLINDDRHKVNLSSPDKVILIDIHQTVCGMSVVDGDWDELKRYNLTELYGQARNANAPSTAKD